MQELEAYCAKCKTKRPIQNPVATFNAAGAPVTRGVCPVCGSSLYRAGLTPAHEGLQPPAPAKPDAKAKAKARAKSPASARRATKSNNGDAGIARNGKLVIVESPAKARTVGRFLGQGYTVRASLGHVRDLLRSELSIDVEHDFKPKYRVPNEKRSLVKEIKTLAGKAQEVYLATDPDREGEAIAWHLLEAADIDPQISKRVVFHEITKPAIEAAFANPRGLDMDLVNAQQARRVLDRLVGYGISPILWQKVRNRLSAGRVQSVALRLVVERERQIQAFSSKEYWTLAAELAPDGSRQTYKAQLLRLNGQEPDLQKRADVDPLVSALEDADFVVSQIKRGERRRKPAAPFITSTLQQEASRRLGYTAKRTMMIAQQLYEGVETGEGGSTGLITYMRTDSTNVSAIAQQEARSYIQQNYGADFVPNSPPQYRTRAVNAQEAHEAIRPTSVFRLPEQVKPFLRPEQFRLYRLIWQRFVASQMEAAVYDTISVEIQAKAQGYDTLWRASGSSVRFPGFQVVYEETRDEDQPSSEDEENANIPAGISEGQKQRLVRFIPEQHFTQPPPRYTEASLVQALEQLGIGRPSTYAPILSTIQDRGYVTREAKRLAPTDTGFLVNDLLVEHFPDIMDTQFTAHMEQDLDEISRGERPWVEVVSEFYGSFEPELERAKEDMPEAKGELLEKVGRTCPLDGGELVVRWGRYGKFISCSNFPTCRYTEPWLERIGVLCPEDGGELVERHTRRGRVFYGCANYPKCTFTSWKKPIPTPCPNCGGLLVIASKREAQCIQCSNRYSLEEVGEKAAEPA